MQCRAIKVSNKMFVQPWPDSLVRALSQHAKASGSLSALYENKPVNTWMKGTTHL